MSQNAWDGTPEGQQRLLFRKPSEKTTRVTEEAIDRSRRGTLAAWREIAIAAAAQAATNLETLTSDDVWEILDASGAEEPREPSAMGPILREAKRIGLIEPTNLTRESNRPKAHRRPMRVWRSLAFHGKTTLW